MKCLSPFGLKGYVKIKLFIELDIMKNISVLYDSNGKTYHIEDFITHHDSHKLKIKDINSPEEASAILKHLELSVDADLFPKLYDDEGVHYIFDLIDKKVLLDNDSFIGYVYAVHNFGAGDILEIALCSFSDEQNLKHPTVFLPFSKECVQEVSDSIIISDLAHQHYILECSQ